MAVLATPLRYGTATEHIVELYWERRRALDPRIAAALELKDAVEDRMPIPLPEQDKSERPLNANLLASGVYGYAERSASTLPDVRCPPAREGDFEVHNRRANARRSAILGWWAMNRLKLGLIKRYLHYYVYASSPVVIRPRPPNGGGRRMRDIPYWHIRDPLSTLPPPGEDIDPTDCIFTFQRSLGWLARAYPDAAHTIEKPKDCSPDLLFDCIEYVDDEITALVVLGQTADRYSPYEMPGGYTPTPRTPRGRPFVEIEWAPNRTGICPAVVPGRICLDERQGQFHGLAGSQWWAGKLMSLAANAAIRDVYADEWFEHAPGQTGQIITTADGAKGILGEVSGGQIKSTHAPPGAASFLVLDRVTEAIRQTGGISAELQGEAGTNIRTARRANQLMSNVVDFPMATAHEVMAAALEEENVRAIATVKAYYPTAKSFYVQWNGRSVHADYDPQETFDTDHNEVRYSFPGTNINDTVIGGMQRVGGGTLSKRSWMDIDPMIEDPEKEWNRVVAEGIESALMSGFQEQVANGTVPPADAARIVRLIRQNGKSLADAIEQVQREAQRRQASSGPPGTPEGPVAPGSPEAQPGLAVPGAGAEQPTIPPQAPGMANLSDLMAGLRRTS